MRVKGHFVVPNNPSDVANPQLAIFGYSEAAMFLRSTLKPNVTGIISIHGNREFGVEADVTHRLDLMFDDVEAARPDDELAMQRMLSRKRWNEQNGLTEIAPTRADAELIIEFAESQRNAEGILLCHCGGGMSRAPAAALICLATWHGPGNDAECVSEVMSLRQGTVPHAGLVRLADELLCRQGDLVRALSNAQAR
jgi:predicted protein tyrosine phosphatase